VAAGLPPDEDEELGVTTEGIVPRKPGETYGDYMYRVREFRKESAMPMGVVDDPKVILPFELSKTAFWALQGKKHGTEETQRRKWRTRGIKKEWDLQKVPGDMYVGAMTHRDLARMGFTARLDVFEGEAPVAKKVAK
jgi:hypothetical protein